LLDTRQHGRPDTTTWQIDPNDGPAKARERMSRPDVDMACRNGLTIGQNTLSPQGGLTYMNVDERIAELTRKMLRRKFFAVLSQPSPTPERLKALLPAHLEYMIALEKRGLLFASGPLTDGEGPPSGAGLTILRASDAREARRLAEADPFVTNGLRTFELKEWTIMEGTLGLRVNLSDQSVEVA
jgi:uncharacterized protein YciI